MSKIVDDVMAANAAYVNEFGDKGDLAIPPSRQFAILTCMDARLDPAKYAGLAEGDAHVIRNAGGREVTTQSDLWSFRISFWALMNGLLSTIPSVGWKHLQTRSWASSWRQVFKQPT